MTDFLGQGPHAAFILSAYAVTVLTLAGLALWVTLDHRRQKRLLADLEARGMTRRSSRAAAGERS